MTLEDALNTLRPLLHEGESATIAKSDDFGDRMIAVEGAARKTNIYDSQAREAITDILTAVKPAN